MLNGIKKFVKEKKEKKKKNKNKKIRKRYDNNES